MEDSRESINCLHVAHLLISNASKFREFFVHYIINCNTQINILWQEFKNMLSEDLLFYIRTAQNDLTLNFTDEINLFGLCEIKKILNAEGYDLSDLNELPQLSANQLLI